MLNYSFDDDPVLWGLRLISNSVPDSNVDLVGSCPGSYWQGEFLKNHDFQCYIGNVLASYDNNMESSSNLVRSLIYKQASDFKNNDEKCCDKAKGKLWYNTGGKLGGFIADSSKILGDNLYIDSNSRICGEGEINTSLNSLYIYDSSIDGQFVITGPGQLRNFVANKGSHIISSGASIINSTVDGKIDMDQNQSLDRTKIKKDSSVIMRGYSSVIQDSVVEGELEILSVQINDSEISGSFTLNSSSIRRSFLKNYSGSNINLSSFSLEDSLVDIIGSFSSQQNLQIRNSNISIFGNIGTGGWTTIFDTQAKSGIFFNNASGLIQIHDFVSSEFSSVELIGEDINLSFVENDGVLSLGPQSRSSYINFSGINNFSRIHLGATSSRENVQNSSASAAVRGVINLKSQLNQFEGNGDFFLTGLIGENVKVFGKVSTNYDIGDNTIIYGPIALNCNVSGIIYSNYECPSIFAE